MFAIIDFVLVSDFFHVFQKCYFQNKSEFCYSIVESLSNVRLLICSEHKMYNDQTL